MSSTTAAGERAISIVRALRLIEPGKIGDLSEHATSLVLGVLPLLKFTDEVLQLDIGAFKPNLRAQLQADR